MKGIFVQPCKARLFEVWTPMVLLEPCPAPVWNSLVTKAQGGRVPGSSEGFKEPSEGVQRRRKRADMMSATVTNSWMLKVDDRHLRANPYYCMCIYIYIVYYSLILFYLCLHIMTTCMSKHNFGGGHTDFW